MHETSSPPELSAREEEALKRTAKCLEGCRIADVRHTSLHPYLPTLPARWANHLAHACRRQLCQCLGCCRLHQELSGIVPWLMIRHAAVYGPVMVALLMQLIADSKFLQLESLVELVKGITHAAGPLQRLNATPESTEAAEVDRL